MTELDWQYSRNRRMHWVDDGEFYDDGHDIGHYLFEIRSCTPLGFVRRAQHGHDLLRKGVFALHSLFVADLKKAAATLANS